VEMQGLLEPLTLEISPEQELALKGHEADLKKYGFELEVFGPRTYLVRALPVLLAKENPGPAILDILDDLARESPAPWEERLAVSLACHGAVKAGQVLSIEEMQELVRELERSTQPRTCPHGRPTTIHLASQQLEREFRRR